MNKLNDYLPDSKLNFSGKSLIHVVIGNEAADIDSIASSIVYAFFRESINSKKEEIFIPVINIHEDDLRLRNEAVYLFSQTGITPENLIFINQINLEELAEKRKLRVILVDHNKPTHTQEFFSDYVEEIIDHHDDEKSYSGITKIIEKTGSTATLVGEKILGAGAGAGEKFLLDRDSAFLLGAAIMIDTSNLSYKSGKTTAKDEKVLSHLVSEYKIDRVEFFKNLVMRKRDLSNLSSRDMLRKDYKEWIMGRKKTGFSSVNLSLQGWLQKDYKLPEEITKYYIENSLDVLFIMIAYSDTEFKRELIFVSGDSSLLDSIYFYLQKCGGRLFPADVKGFDKEKIRFYFLGETLWSRKRLQPILKDFFSSHNK
ncbi:MAG: DHH family phosphoesterase [Spirochaetes bacterium]|nr:DHH family phosphoesterase [Spirochaetota bacterium]